MSSLDRIDQSIIRELQKNARITVTELSSRVGLSKTPCQNRIKRLEDEGYILGYVALINQKKMDASHVTYVQVTMNRTSDMNAYRTVLGEKIAGLPYVQQTSTFVVMEDIKDMDAGVL